MVAALVAAPSASASLPPPDAPLPRDPARLGRTLAQTTAELRAAIDRWVADGDPAVGRPPADVTLLALHQQRIYRLLARERRLGRATLGRLPAWLAAQARDTVAARRELSRITPATRVRAVRVGPARPAGVLRRFYREAEHRFRVGWNVLAAVNLVESAFGRVRSASPAGARGPMQFLPSTWRVYGLGGDVDDPHDAILGAANFLRSRGAPGDYRRALYAYNPSASYVDAVLRYARWMRRDRHAYLGFYSWQVFVRTPSGDRRLTGPGRRS